MRRSGRVTPGSAVAPEAYVSTRTTSSRLVRAKFPRGPRFRSLSMERAFRDRFVRRMNAGKGGTVHPLAAMEIFLVSLAPAPFYSRAGVQRLLAVLYAAIAVALSFWALARNFRGWTFGRAQVASCVAAALYSGSLMAGSALLLPTDEEDVNFMWPIVVVAGLALWPLTFATNFSLLWESYALVSLLFYGMMVALVWRRPLGAAGDPLGSSGARQICIGVFALLFQVLAATLAWNCEITRRLRFASTRALEDDKARLEEKLVDWLASANAPCFAVDGTSLRLTTWNAKIAELTGVPAEVALGLGPHGAAAEAGGGAGAGAGLGGDGGGGGGGVLLVDMAPPALREAMARVLRDAAVGGCGAESFELVVRKGWRPGHSGRGDSDGGDDAASGPLVTLLMNATAHDPGDDHAVAGGDHHHPGGMAAASLSSKQKVVGVGQDITAHVRMEQARKNFLASFSHELRTPLNGMLGMLELLSQLKATLPAKAAHFVARASLSGNLLLNLINDILDLSRIEQVRCACAARD